VVLTDIEGPTAPRRVVADVMVPYVRANLRGWLTQHARDPDIAGWIYEVSALSGASPWDVDGCVDTLLDWLDADLNMEPLKAIQARMWRDAYAVGDLSASVYPDAYGAFDAWRDAEARVVVFSTGSLDAQRSLCRFAVGGDLEAQVHAWFDARVGSKRDPRSYRTIATKLAVSPSQVMFLSDTVEELDAAAAAGMRTVFVARDRSLETSASVTHTTVSSLLELEAIQAPR
jgi:enolase-phosphatase E1